MLLYKWKKTTATPTFGASIYIYLVIFIHSPLIFAIVSLCKPRHSGHIRVNGYWQSLKDLSSCFCKCLIQALNNLVVLPRVVPLWYKSDAHGLSPIWWHFVACYAIGWNPVNFLFLSQHRFCLSIDLATEPLGDNIFVLFCFFNFFFVKYEIFLSHVKKNNLLLLMKACILTH